MNESQLTEIRTYLLSKKLPLDLLIEVEDHFTSQILDMQNEENIDFNAAFEKVKLSWKDEFKMRTWQNGKKVTNISYKLDGRKSSTVVYFGMFIAMIFSVILYSIMNFIDYETFEIGIYSLIISGFLAPILILILNFNDFLLIKKFKKVRLNIHQNQIIFLFIAFIFILMQSSQLNTSSLEKFYKSTVEPFQSLGFAKWTFFTITSFLYFAGLFSQIQFIKVLKKTKPYLKNFKQAA